MRRRRRGDGNGDSQWTARWKTEHCDLAGSGSGGWATRWRSGWRRPARTSPSGTARARRPSRWRSTARKSRGTLPDLAACDIVFVMVSTWDDVKEVVAGPAGLLSGGEGAEARRRMLVDLGRRLGGVARDASGARRRIAGRAGQRQREGDQGRPPVVRVLGSADRVRRGCAVPEDDRARRELRRRRRARAHRARSATTSSWASSRSRSPRSRCSRRRPACRGTRSSTS